jgi:uncharacterized protein YndB with AHSA1/START domain
MEPGVPRGYSRELDEGMADFIATASAVINERPSRVWAVLTDNELLGEVMFGSEIFTD